MKEQHIITLFYAFEIFGFVLTGALLGKENWLYGLSLFVVTFYFGLYVGTRIRKLGQKEGSEYVKT